MYKVFTLYLHCINVKKASIQVSWVEAEKHTTKSVSLFGEIPKLITNYKPQTFNFSLSLTFTSSHISQWGVKFLSLVVRLKEEVTLLLLNLPKWFLGIWRCVTKSRQCFCNLAKEDSQGNSECPESDWSKWLIQRRCCALLPAGLPYHCEHVSHCTPGH